MSGRVALSESCGVPSTLEVQAQKGCFCWPFVPSRARFSAVRDRSGESAIPQTNAGSRSQPERAEQEDDPRGEDRAGGLERRFGVGRGLGRERVARALDDGEAERYEARRGDQDLDDGDGL